MPLAPDVRMLDARHLPLLAQSAVARRLGCDPYALRAVEQHGETALLRFGNLGTALAVQAKLEQLGYQAEHGGISPDGFGHDIRVTTGAAVGALTALRQSPPTTTVFSQGRKPSPETTDFHAE